MSDSHSNQVVATPTVQVAATVIPIDANVRIESLELRVRNLEAQHVWLRIEQLEAQVRSMAKVLASLVDRDGGAAA